MILPVKVVFVIAGLLLLPEKASATDNVVADTFSMSFRSRDIFDFSKTPNRIERIFEIYTSNITSVQGDSNIPTRCEVWKSFYNPGDTDVIQHVYVTIAFKSDDSSLPQAFRDHIDSNLELVVSDLNFDGREQLSDITEAFSTTRTRSRFQQTLSGDIPRNRGPEFALSRPYGNVISSLLPGVGTTVNIDQPSDRERLHINIDHADDENFPELVIERVNADLESFAKELSESLGREITEASPIEPFTEVRFRSSSMALGMAFACFVSCLVALVLLV